MGDNNVDDWPVDTGWNWESVGLAVLPNTHVGQAGYGDNQSFTLDELNGNHDDYISMLADVSRLFALKVRNSQTHTIIGQPFVWGYDWSNHASAWQSGDPPEAEYFCAVSYKHGGSGVFSNIQNITGLP